MSVYKDLPEFLVKHSIKNDSSHNTISTHTRIGSKTSSPQVYGGNYSIPSDDLSTFYKLYYDCVFNKKKYEHLTEKQLTNGTGPMLVDLDFRYKYEVIERQHTIDDIIDIIQEYLIAIKECFVITEDCSFPIFVFEKPNINRVADKQFTKDGIHMIFGLQTDNAVQQIIRNRVIQSISDVSELPCINPWDSVFDEGISKGTTNWQLYGSRKPNNEAYVLTNKFVVTFDIEDNGGNFVMDECDLATFNIESNFNKLTAQYDKHQRFEINSKIEKEKLKYEQNPKKIKKSSSKIKINKCDNNNDQDDTEEIIDYDKIIDKETLDIAVEQMLNNLSQDEFELKEIHNYTQILPEKYYNPGTHSMNMQVAFALKHTSEKLFLTWILLRSKAHDFDYNEIPEKYNSWINLKTTSTNGSCVTKRSILYWARQDVPNEYNNVKKDTVDYYIEQSLLNRQTEFDIAQVLYQVCKDKYACAGYDKNSWYIFKNHKWSLDKGVTLRYLLSTDIHLLYFKKQEDTLTESQQYDPNDSRQEQCKDRGGHILNIMTRLKKTSDKNNIMREAQEIFYDELFLKNIDTNPYLLCFKNGVIDFKTKTFRHGYPQDYITKSTNINYIPSNEINSSTELTEYKTQLYKLMDTLFPIKDLNEYMWEHLASTLIGTNPNQTFNIYYGSGSNGKSMLTDLMSKTLGDLKVLVPISLVSDKRQKIGGTSSEVIQIKGCRYGAMQELTKGTVLNDGSMKELTGGDPIQGRALFCESETFIPQLSLIVCANVLFEFCTNDDGTWRRVRKCDFVSKFIDEGDTANYGTPYVFIKDKTLSQKLPILAPVFASLLVDIAFKTNGVTTDCDTVLKSTKKYRNEQDYITSFVEDKLLSTNNTEDKIGKRGLSEAFKLWFTQENGNRKVPKMAELTEYMNNKYGQYKNNKWSGVKFTEDDTNEEDDVNENDFK